MLDSSNNDLICENYPRKKDRDRPFKTLLFGFSLERLWYSLVSLKRYQSNCVTGDHSVLAVLTVPHFLYPLAQPSQVLRTWR